MQNQRLQHHIKAVMCIGRSQKKIPIAPGRIGKCPGLAQIMRFIDARDHRARKRSSQQYQPHRKPTRQITVCRGNVCRGNVWGDRLTWCLSVTGRNRICWKSNILVDQNLWKPNFFMTWRSECTGDQSALESRVHRSLTEQTHNRSFHCRST